MRYERPWVVWPWQSKCRARLTEGTRCELKREHEGEHAAERGMYDILWSEEVRTETPYNTIPRA